MNCRICGNKNLKLFLDLGHHPPSDAFLTEEQLQEPEIHYPLQVYYCERCGLSQLGYIVPKEILFGDDYPYTTGTNKAGVEHFREFAREVTKKYSLTKNDLVVDIGGNDGTLLEGFNTRTVNVEPVKTIESKVGKVTQYWSCPTAHYIEHKHGKAKVILATNVFAHVDDIHDFMEGVDVLLADDGAFIIEAPHMDELLRNNEYDTIYHEHLSYLSHKPIEYLCNMYDMTIVDSKYIDFHGGSYRYCIHRICREG